MKNSRRVKRRYLPGKDMRFWGEDCKSMTLVLGSDLVISQLLHKFGPGYHFSEIGDLLLRPSKSPITPIQTPRFPSSSGVTVSEKPNTFKRNSGSRIARFRDPKTSPGEE
jgi:hypothetical protein|uniref:Uncharacterized protein n=1 Tax=Fagus sylvatica TaxID=28930 RepID=A0A2N9IYG7_FAGSY